MQLEERHEQHHPNALHLREKADDYYEFCLIPVTNLGLFLFICNTDLMVLSNRSHPAFTEVAELMSVSSWLQHVTCTRSLREF